MGVIMLDYVMDFDRDVLCRLADVGCREVLLFDAWHKAEPARGQYVFEPLVQYARDAREAGLRLLVQTPVGVPLWSPLEWFLQNAQGQRNDFLAVMASYGFPGRLCFESAIALGQRFWSYWNRDAEDYFTAYVAKVRSVVEPEGAVCISSIGTVGEYFFPAMYWYPFLKTASSPWWHDPAAAAAFRQYSERNPGAARPTGFGYRSTRSPAVAWPSTGRSGCSTCRTSRERTILATAAWPMCWRRTRPGCGPFSLRSSRSTRGAALPSGRRRDIRPGAGPRARPTSSSTVASRMFRGFGGSLRSALLHVQLLPDGTLDLREPQGGEPVLGLGRTFQRRRPSSPNCLTPVVLTEVRDGSAACGLAHPLTISMGNSRKRGRS